MSSASARELVKFLLRQGYRRVRQTGSHIVLHHSIRSTLVIRMHPGDLAKGLFRRILKDAGFTIADYRNQ